MKPIGYYLLIGYGNINVHSLTSCYSNLFNKFIYTSSQFRLVLESFYFIEQTDRDNSPI